jgi:acetyltransferase-like isoleucine patch superfamily enzyme
MNSTSRAAGVRKRVVSRSCFTHPQAIVETGSIGEGSRIWAFSHVMRDVTIGRDCTISNHCWIESGVVIGDNVTVKTHVAIPEGVTIEDDVFIGPNATFMNDMKPRSHNARWVLRRTRISRGATVGSAATVVCGVTLGPWCFVGAGSVVTRDVPAYALVKGNPGRVAGYVCQCREKIAPRPGRAVACGGCGLRYRLGLAGVALVRG